MADWGFYLAPDAPRGSGLTLGAVPLDYAFRQLGIDKVIGQVMESNQRSAALHARLGFRRTGSFTRACNDGLNSMDMLQFELSAVQWPLTRPTESPIP